MEAPRALNLPKPPLRRAVFCLKLESGETGGQPILIHRWHRLHRFLSRPPAKNHVNLGMAHFPLEIGLHFCAGVKTPPESIFIPPFPQGRGDKGGMGENTSIDCKCLQISEPCLNLRSNKKTPESSLKVYPTVRRRGVGEKSFAPTIRLPDYATIRLSDHLTNQHSLLDNPHPLTYTNHAPKHSHGEPGMAGLRGGHRVLDPQDLNRIMPAEGWHITKF